MGHRSTLLRRILLAMGLSSLPLAAQYGCVEPRPSSDDDDTGSDPLDIDDDEDGYTENTGDCDDQNNAIHPAATEVCDEVDNDCDGTTDEDDASDAPTWYPDGDEDSYGDDQQPRSACEQPQGFIADSSDCNDQNDAIHPAATEVCDEVDNDCDGTIDEDDASDAPTWYEDSDDDGHGNLQSSALACEQPDGFVADSSDCDDSSDAISPSSPELPGDGLDNNCSGFIDEVACADAPQATAIADIPTNLPADVMFCEVLPPSGLCPEPTVAYIDGLINATVGPPSMSWCHWYVINSCGPADSGIPDCCYVVELDEMCAMPGRPLRIDGAPRLAPLVPSGAWSEQVEAEFSSLPAERRDALLARWSEAAQLEHASVASFARFSLQLLAVGAPPDLIAGATRAQGDEIAHARSCFGVASVLAGRELGPGPLDIQGTWSGQTDMAALLEENLREGCINETLAAAEAAWLAERCTVPALAETLATIAEDEARHAALAWRTARWVLQQRPDLADLAARILRSATALGSDPTNLPHDDAWMAEYGCMPAKAAVELRSEVWQQVLAPARRALLGSLDRHAAA